VEDAARAIKITPRTLYRWQQDSEFDSAYRKARRAAFGQGAARLQQASGAAVFAGAARLQTKPVPGSTTRQGTS
jgi:hypothetical protein